MATSHLTVCVQFMFEANILDSFTEVRRGFEFHQSSEFLLSTTLRGQHNKHESMFSSASISVVLSTMSDCITPRTSGVSFLR
ncbi:hypothetical protein K503DRAFT_777928 [Rhizopogon vinicolor AM-OR11-026]|uniref:Uncharacterized protein n=1 Tax=Rhizopogon vinicolor AM-OR11-026 TaxID=1314800 RepID=A0A1B7MEH2_9AGAM|nr:hypothetical protein K503DRAFT_777928 [Rhizopogon vinicolor AM-OR11-026]